MYIKILRYSIQNDLDIVTSFTNLLSHFGFIKMITILNVFLQLRLGRCYYMDCESYGLLAVREELQSSNDFREIKIFHFPGKKTDHT